MHWTVRDEGSRIQCLYILYYYESIGPIGGEQASTHLRRWMLLAPCAQLRLRNVSKSGSHTLTLTRARASTSGTFLLLLTLECTGLAGAAASAHASQLLLLCLLFATCCCHSYSHSCVLGRLLMALQISDPSCESWYLNTVTSSCTFS